jgi:hypothetical protein
MAMIDDEISGKDFEENKRAFLAYSKRVDCPQNWRDDAASILALRLLGFREDALCNYVLATSPSNGARRLQTR